MIRSELEIEELLAVGQPAVLHTDPARKDGPRYPTAIRGWHVGSYILFDVPYIENPFAVFGQLRSCVIRFLSKGEACAFTSAILNTVEKGTRYLKVAWPRLLKSVSIRQHERVSIRIPCQIAFEQWDLIEGEILDLSAGGCCLRMDMRVQPYTTLKVTFDLPDSTHLENVKTTVRSVRPSGDGFALGCMFDDDEDHARVSCDFYVSTTLACMRSNRRSQSRAVLLDGDLGRAEAVRAQLESLGYQVSIVCGVLDAFFSLRVSPPVAMLLGTGQKELPALDICRIVRATHGFQQIPLFIYGEEDAEIRSRHAEFGVTGYITDLERFEDVVPRLAPESEEPEADEEAPVESISEKA